MGVLEAWQRRNPGAYGEGRRRLQRMNRARQRRVRSPARFRPVPERFMMPATS
eukprot:NODE_15056_length_226_cov_5.118644_g14143_i0.p1 GENE.NODE_15056_length_226_cov_5.118644_g14143_i0~~NODE_15056_length_226_cov_5.118644_g14143_i0.p1  ORF type:complete len:60 (-),score=16.48 NODE_15056_length_226_cov_5.118644_g14143_i0:46-204(-)